MELREIVSGIHGIFIKLIVTTGNFGRNSLCPDTHLLDDAGRVFPDMRRLGEDLCRELSRCAAMEPSAIKYATVPGHVERICEHFEHISGLLRTKTLEKIHFSDKALDEMGLMLERLKDMLSDAADMLMDADARTAELLKRAETAISRSAGDFAALHDERLREGICLPKAGTLYLGLLEDVKTVAWHLKEMARDLLE